MPKISIDTRELRDLAQHLRKVEPDLLKELQAGLKGAALTVAVEARLIAGFNSASIPPTIRPFARGLTAGVRAGGGKKGPLARLMEGPQPWRHPVFGNRNVWRRQFAHPFLAPALLKESPNIERAALAAVEAAFLKAGFH